MFALAIRYLNGWAMAAADGARKEQAEWPPHPDRLFMALAAAWFETGEDPAEGEALRWLEGLEPPAISASDSEQRRASGGNRPPVSYVPVNDVRVGRKIPATSDIGRLRDAGLATLPEHRSRQPRAFPVAVPHSPMVHFVWPDADPGPHRGALSSLAHKVTHVGHSASFVQAWITDDEVQADWEPTTGIAEIRLRVANRGRLEHLAQRCNRAEVVKYADLKAHLADLKGKEKTRMKDAIAERFGNQIPVSLRPEPGGWQGYSRRKAALREAAPGSVFDPQLVVLGMSGKRLGLPATLKLTEALRGALMSACPQQPPPEWFSGHTVDSKPTSQPHLALAPLPFVGSDHADGRVMGVALILPADLVASEASKCLGPFLHEQDTGLTRPTKLFHGKWLECTVELDTRDSQPANLCSSSWTRPSRIWASVTPVVLDRHFDGKDKWDRAAESVKLACERIGLPRPKEVLLHAVSLVEGVPHAREFPYLTRKSDGGRRHHSHAVIVFDEPVHGPVLVGAGRFRGYGLCRPMDNRGDAS